MSIIKTPFYKINTLYSITINPNDAHQGCLKGGSHGRLVQVKSHLWNVLNKYPEIYYILHLDISEPRKCGPTFPRVHFHGMVMFPNNKAIQIWLLDTLRVLSKWCNIDIDTVSDTSVWETYCRKYDTITEIKPLNNHLEWSKPAD